MFCQNREQTIANLSENRLIEQIRTWLGDAAPPPPLGIGDDCAVIDPVEAAVKQLLTTDSVSFGQHFDDKVGPKEAGAKLIKRNLSDIAGMGGTPGPALLNLMMGPDLSIQWLENFISGVRETCESYQVTIVGGDISLLPGGQFTANLTLTGTTGKRALLRSTASIGDTICVTGSLGGSILKKHFDFTPRLDEGRWLAAQEECTSMMDLTDGLGKDLAAILPDQASANIETAKLPVSEDAIQCAASDEKSPEEHAFCDGEDYELLFTVKNSDLEEFIKKWQQNFPETKLSPIGTIVKKESDCLYRDAKTGDALPWQTGFELFRKA